MSRPDPDESMKDCSVVVTGGAGFLGRVVVQKLRDAGYQRIGVLCHDTLDLTKAVDIERMFNAYEPKVVIHLAALCGGIGANMARPAEFFYDNAMMGMQLMDASYRHDVRKFIAVGSACAYPRDAPVPLREESLWDGYPEETNAPYGLAKRMLLVQAQAYRKQYGFNAIYLLPANLYGPGDNFDRETSHVIPGLIREFVKAREEHWDMAVCWGTGRPSREFLYVDDAADAIILALERYNGGEPVNIGTGSEIAIWHLAEKLKQLTGFAGRIDWAITQPDGQPRRCLDTAMAEIAFGFTAQTSLGDGLRKTIDWYELHRRTADADTETE